MESAATTEAPLPTLAQEWEALRDVLKGFGSTAAHTMESVPTTVPVALHSTTEFLSREKIIQRLKEANKISEATTYELSLDSMKLSTLEDASGALPLTPYNKLRKLTMNNNFITNEEQCVEKVMALLPDLRELQVEFNVLQRKGPVLNNNNAARLETLSLMRNNLIALPELALPKLTSLSISFNKIGETGLDGNSLRLPNLTHLDLSHNGLSTVHGALSALTKINILNLSYNQLTSLQGIEAMTALEELDASHNQLRIGGLSSSTNPLRAFAHALQLLDLSRNEISSLAFFPNTGFAKLLTLSIAGNKFLGETNRKQSIHESKAGGFNNARKKSRKEDDDDDMAFIDDIEDAEYDNDETTPSQCSSTTASTKKASMLLMTKDNNSKAGGGKQSKPSSGMVGSKKRGSVDTAASEIPSARSVASTRSTRLGTPEAEKAASFLARLAALIPNVETLDLSQNSQQIIADYSDLKVLGVKCKSLTELMTQGTLNCGGEAELNVEEHIQAVRSQIPQLEALDGVELVKREPVSIEDLEQEIVTASFLEDRPNSTSGNKNGKNIAQSTGAKGTPTVKRLGSAAMRPTSASSTVTAMHASKATKDLQEIRNQFASFFQDAQRTREQCNQVLDFLQADTEWAYGKGEQPDEEQFRQGEKRTEDVGEMKELEELDALLDEEERLANLSKFKHSIPQTAQNIHIVPKENTPLRQTPTKPELPTTSSSVYQPSPQSKKMLAQQIVNKKETNSGGGGKPRASSSQSTRQLMETDQTMIMPRCGSGNQVNSVSRRTASSGGGGHAMAPALQQIRRTQFNKGSSFLSEQQQFKNQMKAEAEERWAEILNLTGGTPGPSMPQQTASFFKLQQKKKPAMVDNSTCTTSPSKDGGKQNTASSNESKTGGKMVESCTSTSPQRITKTVPPLQIASSTETRQTTERSKVEDRNDDFTSDEDDEELYCVTKNASVSNNDGAPEGGEEGEQETIAQILRPSSANVSKRSKMGAPYQFVGSGEAINTTSNLVVTENLLSGGSHKKDGEMSKRLSSQSKTAVGSNVLVLEPNPSSSASMVLINRTNDQQGNMDSGARSKVNTQSHPGASSKMKPIHTAHMSGGTKVQQQTMEGSTSDGKPQEGAKKMKMSSQNAPSNVVSLNRRRR